VSHRETQGTIFTIGGSDGPSFHPVGLIYYHESVKFLWLLHRLIPEICQEFDLREPSAFWLEQNSHYEQQEIYTEKVGCRSFGIVYD
jgi:hypothetical protein